MSLWPRSCCHVHNVMTILEEVSFIGSRYRVSAEIRISSAEKLSQFFSMQPPEGDFTSQLQHYVNDRKRSREDNDAPICNDFCQYAVIIMEIILLWKRSFVRVCRHQVSKAQSEWCKESGLAQSQSLFVKFSAACMQEMWWTTSCY